MLAGCLLWIAGCATPKPPSPAERAAKICADTPEQCAEARWTVVLEAREKPSLKPLERAVAAFEKAAADQPDQFERRMRAHIWLGQAYRERSVFDEARAHYDKALELYAGATSEQRDQTNELAAQAQFERTDLDFEQWAEISITGPIDEQKGVLENVVAQSKSMQKGYEKVFGYRSDEWTVAAATRIGLIFSEFADKLANVEIPFEPGTDEHALYRRQLEDMVVPLEDKALDTLQRTVQRADEKGVDTEWVARARQAIGELQNR